MSKEMIVSVNGREKKIAILDNGKVTEFYIERGEENSGVVGNVYKGRVMRVLPGMQSAFIRIWLLLHAVLRSQGILRSRARSGTPAIRAMSRCIAAHLTICVRSIRRSAP